MTAPARGVHARHTSPEIVLGAVCISARAVAFEASEKREAEEGAA
jgi:hypothetical protein